MSAEVRRVTEVAPPEVPKPHPYLRHWSDDPVAAIVSVEEATA